MTDTEVNKIIAEYMGLEYPYQNQHCFVDECNNTYDLYTQSLDALVPVWERLDELPFFAQLMEKPRLYSSNHRAFMDIEIRHKYDSGWHFTLQQAAAHATAMAIKEITNEQ